MGKIYVTGHRNPDTDSIAAAIAYASLRHALGNWDYVAARLGAVNDETQILLDRFGFSVPPLLLDMRTQVQDLEYDHPPALTGSVTIDKAWRVMRESKLKSLPIVNEDGTLYGTLSTGDVAEYDMEAIDNNRVASLPLFNLLSVLEGTLVNEYMPGLQSVSGRVTIAIPQNSRNWPDMEPDTVLVCGNQPEVVECAIQCGVNCVVLCQARIDPQWAKCQSTCIISTALSAQKASRAIFQAISVDRICQTENVISFHRTDYLDDVREVMVNSRYRSYPVLDEENRVVGAVSRYHLLRPRRKQLVLVDHNEVAQSVSGLEQVEILEIIDHHRLGDIQTSQPIRIRNEPVGSTNTILAAMYQECGVVPSPNMAGLMAGAILSDTVLFKSPTCTKQDILMAEQLSKIAGISLEELGKTLFYFDVSKSVEELFQTDCKEFHISGQSITVSQITSDSSEQLLERKDSFLTFMGELKRQKGLDMVLLMLTDVLLEGTILLYVGSDDTIRKAFSAEPKDRQLFLPSVMSRKKQLIPMLTALWG